MDSSGNVNEDDNMSKENYDNSDVGDGDNSINYNENDVNSEWY